MKIMNFKAGVCGRVTGNNEFNCSGLSAYSLSNS